jgi:hypothetical protein
MKNNEKKQKKRALKKFATKLIKKSPGSKERKRNNTEKKPNRK